MGDLLVFPERAPTPVLTGTLGAAETWGGLPASRLQTRTAFGVCRVGK